MITWMVTRLGFAVLWPRSQLPTIEQPLSGELAFSREAAGILAADPRVKSQSDWGVDTAITFATIAHGLSVYESYIARGKDHALYSSLTDIKVMMVECLGALQRLRSTIEPIEVQLQRTSEPPDSVSQQIAQQIGFDIEATQILLAERWTTRQEALLTAHFPENVAARARMWRDWPDTSWMDEQTWFATLAILLDHFVPDDDDWIDLAFRLWVGRVLHYTLRIAVRGHAFADAYLHQMVTRAIADFA
jgi:mannosylglycerate synthase